MPRLFSNDKYQSLMRRHKVIGFVDAATEPISRLHAGDFVRHKVIGFVDAATAVIASVRNTAGLRFSCERGTTNHVYLEATAMTTRA